MLNLETDLIPQTAVHGSPAEQGIGRFALFHDPGQEDGVPPFVKVGRGAGAVEVVGPHAHLQVRRRAPLELDTDRIVVVAVR